MHRNGRFLTRLRRLFRERGMSGLSAGILTAMCAGLLLPAIIGGLMLATLRHDQVENELKNRLNRTTKLLAQSLSNPVWNFDRAATRSIAEASLLDPQVVSITITDVEASRAPIVHIDRPERRLGTTNIAREDLVMDGITVGHVELELDDHLTRLEFRRDQRAYYLILLGQFILALALIVIAIRFWVLKPLARLTGFSNRLADGDLEQPIDWTRSDEIGHLAQQLDQMRSTLRTAFAEQQAILRSVQVGVIFARDRTIQLANRHAEKIFGYGAGEMHGQSTRILYQSDDQYQATGERAYTAIAAQEGRYAEELRLQHRSGNTFWAEMRGCALDSNLPQAGSIWVFEDITARKSAENEINKLAFYDPLTHLPNRRLLLDRLKQALASSARNENEGALLFIDLDNFKMLNDTRGHDIGDLLLQQVAERLDACIREGDTVARLGGDEFVVMLEGLSKNRKEAAAQATIVGEKIIRVLNQPYPLNNVEHQGTSSIGITLFDDFEGSENPVDGLLKQADLAMYQAKAGGRNTLRFFNPEMQTVVTARAALESALREAVLKNQFALYYQPQVDASRRLIGVEALIRWHHPQHGLISPAEFIPLAEDTGLILPLGHWVIETACAQLTRWASRPEFAHITISVNVSARQFRHRDFVEQVVAVLDQSGANPHRLKIELTESLLVDDVEGTIAKMNALKEKGVCFALDDFGTGYSSLYYLKRLPLEQLKIDQGFVRDILTDPNDAAIAKMLMVLGDSLGLAVIAEGVETEGQKDFLAGHGCRYYQGYLFGRPIPLDEFEATFLE